MTVELEKAYRKLDCSKRMIYVAREALALQQERPRLVSDQLKIVTADLAKYDQAVSCF